MKKIFHLDLFAGVGGFALAVDTVWPGSEHIFCDNGFELTKSRHRVERLKSLGNAILPQVAVEIMRAIKTTVDNGNA